MDLSGGHAQGYNVNRAQLSAAPFQLVQPTKASFSPLPTSQLVQSAAAPLPSRSEFQMTADVSATTFDLIIIGAGINGAGIARDAAMRGLKVLVLDKGDIGSGTSSWSTRLIHGGLRYLEHGEFGLIRESLREREVLLRIASHLVSPIPILIPIYQDGSRGRVTIRAGMIAYDLLS